MDTRKPSSREWSSSARFIKVTAICSMSCHYVAWDPQLNLNSLSPSLLIKISNIAQVTGPVARFSRQIASQGYIVAAPSSYHEFTGPAPLAYDVPGTDMGNAWKIEKKLEAYDEDATLSVDHLTSMPTCNGMIGATGMCLGGHLAYRCAFDKRVSAAVCYFATDIHSHSLGSGKNDDSLARTANGDLRHAELVMIFGKKDTHVPRPGRDMIRKTLEDSGTVFSLFEVAHAQHAFIRDELSKGRYDPAIAGICWQMFMECFGRCLRADLGPRDGGAGEPEHVC
jgi:carboxymethylenebutenolidase